MKVIFKVGEEESRVFIDGSPHLIADTPIPRLSDLAVVSRLHSFLSPLPGDTPPDQLCRVWLPVRPVERLNWHAIISCLFARVAVLTRGFASTGLRPLSGKESRSKSQFHTCLD